MSVSIISLSALLLLLSPTIHARTVDLTDANFEDEVYKQPSFILFFAPWCGYCQKIKPDWEKLTQAFAKHDQVLIGSVNCDENKEMAQKFDVKGYPTLKFFKGKDEDPVGYDGDRELQAMVEYVNSQTGIKVRVAVEPDPVRELDADGLKAAVANPDKNHFVVFYAPWCGHCKTLLPQLGNVVKAMFGDDSIEVVKVDADKHSEIGERYGVTGYPTLKLFLADGTEVPFDGGRQPNDILNFINKHVGTHRHLPDGRFDTGAWPSDELKQIVEKFAQHIDQTEKESLQAQAESAAKSATGRFAKYAHFYPKLMKKAVAKPEFLDTESARLEKLLLNSMGDEPKLNAFYRLTILKQLKGESDEPQAKVQTTGADDDKDEL